MAIPGTPEYHREWTANRAIEDAQRANERALRDAVVAYEDAQIPPPEIAWSDPDLPTNAMDYDSQAQLARAVNVGSLAEDDQIRQNLGARAPSQFDVAEAAALRGGVADDEAAAIRQALMQGYNAPSAPNPLRPIREQYAEDMLGTGRTITELDSQGNVVERPDGLLNAEQWHTEQLHGAQVEEQRAHAAAYGQEAARQQAQIDVMEQKAIRDAQRQQDAIKASQVVMAKVSEAADRLNESPDIDPNRYWASQSAGRKFGWAVSAGLLGWAGLNPFGALQSAIQNDIDAQKATFAQKQAAFGARTEELGASRNIYQDIRQAIGDEQATDLMMEAARLQQAESAFKAMAIKEGIPPQIAANNVFMQQMGQRHAEIWKTLEEMVAKTPQRIGGGYKPLVKGFERKVLEGRLKELDSRGSEMGKLAITQGGAAAGDEATRRNALELETIKGQNEALKAQATEAGKGEAEILKTSRDWGTVETMIDDFLAAHPGDIEGHGIPLTGSRGERISVDSFKTLLPQMMIKAITGANFSPEQKDAAYRLMEGDWNEFSDEDFRHRLRALKTLVSAQRKYMARPMQTPNAQVERTSQFTTFQPSR